MDVYDIPLDFGGQEITVGKLVIYAQGGRITCGEVERLTPKRVVIKGGKMVPHATVFVLDEKWVVNS